MRAFDFFRPQTLEEATAKAGKDHVFKAGGIDLLDRLKERVEAPGTLIDLLPLKNTYGRVEVTGDGFRTLFALATLREVAEAEALAAPAYDALRQAAADAATPQIRNRATVGGNLLQQTRCWYYRSAAFGCAHDHKGPSCLARDGDNRYHSVLGALDCVRVHPSNLAPPLLALGATVLVGKSDTEMRNLPLRELYPKHPLAALPEHTLAPDEVLLFVQVPPLPAGTRSAYRESREKQNHDWATTAAAVRLQMQGRRIVDAAICLGAVAPVPWSADDAAKLLIGEDAGPALFARAADRAFDNALALTHNAYKIPVGKAVLIDALTAAAAGS